MDKVLVAVVFAEDISLSEWLLSPLETLERFLAWLCFFLGLRLVLVGESRSSSELAISLPAWLGGCRDVLLFFLGLPFRDLLPWSSPSSPDDIRFRDRF